MIDGIPNRPLYFYQKDIVDSHCQTHSVLRCARMPVSMPELIRRLKPCQKMSPRSWLATDPDSTWWGEAEIRLWMNHFIVEDQHAWCVGMGMFINVYLDSCIHMMIPRKSNGGHRRNFWLFLCGGSDLPMSSRSQDEMLQSLTSEVRPWFGGQRHVAIVFQAGVSENEVYLQVQVKHRLKTCCNRENHVEIVEAVALASGNQTQHWNIHHFLMIFSCKSPFIGDFPPHLITCDYWREFSQRETPIFFIFGNSWFVNFLQDTNP